MMETTTCTITKDGLYDEYGRPLTVGQSYTGDINYVYDLVQKNFATVTDSSIFQRDTLIEYRAGTVSYFNNGTEFVAQPAYATDSIGNVIGLTSPTGTVIYPESSAFDTISLTSSSNISANGVRIGKISCTTGGTITLYDNTAASGLVLYTATLTAGQVIDLTGTTAYIGVYASLTTFVGTITLAAI